MLQLQAGIFLQSTALLNNTIFSNAIILLTEYNKNGAVGFVVNHPFRRSLNELEEFRHSKEFPLYAGGPVDKEHLFVLHRRPDIIDGSIVINNEIHLGGNFAKAVVGINNGSLSSADVKIFVGYCGWDGGELEAEIEEGSWVITEASSDTVFK